MRPSRGNEEWRQEIVSHMLLVLFRGTPLVAGATTFPPAPLGALWMLGISGNLSLWQLQRENHTTGLSPWKCTPSAAFGGVSPRESVSHDSQSPAAPYESCSLATPEGEILAALCLVILMKLNEKQRANFPLRGAQRTHFEGATATRKM